MHTHTNNTINIKIRIVPQCFGEAIPRCPICCRNKALYRFPQRWSIIWFQKEKKWPERDLKGHNFHLLERKQTRNKQLGIAKDGELSIYYFLSFKFSILQINTHEPCNNLLWAIKFKMPSCWTILEISKAIASTLTKCLGILYPPNLSKDRQNQHRHEDNKMFPIISLTCSPFLQEIPAASA